MKTHDPIDNDVALVVELGRKAEEDFNRHSTDTRRRNIGEEIPCPEGCGGVMWRIGDREVCGDCRFSVG